MSSPPGQWVLHVDGGLAEVERHWIELAASGMTAAAEVDEVATVHFERDRTSVTGDDGAPHTPPGLAGRWEYLPDRDWHARWQADLMPVRAGRLVVTPSWKATGAAHELVIDPGQAFGTGHHETTSSCLEALDRLHLAGRTVLDVGTGTGVLAIAAARRGGAVTAVDIDPLAVAAATANAARNDAHVAVRLGGVESVAGTCFDVVVANLDSATLLAHTDGLARLVAAGGRLIVSGVSNARSSEVANAFEHVGLAVEQRPGSEWTLLDATWPTS